MITIVDKYNTIEYRGLSTDTKPTAGVFNGSSFVEIDSGKHFLFNAAASQWVEYAGGGGSGGGGDPGYSTDVTYYLKDAAILNATYDSGFWVISTDNEEIPLDQIITDFTNVIVEIDGTKFKFVEENSSPGLSIDNEGYWSWATLYSGNANEGADLSAVTFFDTDQSGLGYYCSIEGDEGNPPQTISIYKVEDKVEDDFKAATESCYVEPTYLGTWYERDHITDTSLGTPSNPFEFTVSSGSAGSFNIWPREAYVEQSNANVWLDNKHYYLAYIGVDDQTGNTSYELYSADAPSVDPSYTLIATPGWDWFNIHDGTESLEDGDHTLTIYTDNGTKPTAAFQNAVKDAVANPDVTYDLVIKSSKTLDDVSITASNLSIVQGSFEQCMKKIVEDGQYIKVKVYSIIGDDNSVYYQDYIVYGVYADQGYNNDIEIYTSTLTYLPSVVVRDAAGSGTETVYGGSASKAKITITESGLSLDIS